MSQHFFKVTLPDGRNAEVLMGWDRPCKELFGTIFLDDDEVLWSSMYGDSACAKDMSVLVSNLEKHGVTVPSEIQQEVLQDRIFDVGNRIVRW